MKEEIENRPSLMSIADMEKFFKSMPHLSSIPQVLYCAVENPAPLAGMPMHYSPQKDFWTGLADAGFCGEVVIKDLRKMKPPRMLDLPYEPISKDEKQRLLTYVAEDNPAYGGILYFLIRLGWRPAETISIRIKNIRFKALIPVSIKIEAGDRKNRREFIFSSLDKGLREVIMRLYDPNAEYLFRNSVGNKVRYNHFNLYLRNVSKEVIGREVTSKLFRKSVVTELLDEGIAPKNVMGVTGHRDVKVLLRHYSHQTDPGTTKALKLTEV